MIYPAVSQSIQARISRRPRVFWLCCTLRAVHCVLYIALRLIIMRARLGVGTQNKCQVS